VEVAGTTTFAKKPSQRWLTGTDWRPPGSYESAAQAPAGPENPANPQAVAVLVDGEKVAYLSL
jgi:hypothetical protein